MHPEPITTESALAALTATDGHRKQAAALLGVSPHTLSKWLLRAARDGHEVPAPSYEMPDDPSPDEIKAACAELHRQAGRVFT